MLPFFTPGQAGTQRPGGAATPGTNLWGTAVQDAATSSQMMDFQTSLSLPFTLPILMLTVLAHVKCREARNSTAGNENSAFLCHPGGLKTLKTVSSTGPSIPLRAGGFWMCGALPCVGLHPWIQRPPKSPLHMLPSTKQWLGAGEKFSLLCALSHGAFYFCSALLCGSANTS